MIVNSENVKSETWVNATWMMAEALEKDGYHSLVSAADIKFFLASLVTLIDNEFDKGLTVNANITNTDILPNKKESYSLTESKLILRGISGLLRFFGSFYSCEDDDNVLTEALRKE